MRLRLRLGMVSVLMLTLLAWSPGLTALAAPHNQFPEVIDLPAAFQPEGVAMGRGTTIYAGSTTSGAIYTADIRTGDGQLLVPAQSGRAALGLEFDPRTGYLFVAGGPTGQGYIYDSS